MSSRLRPRTRTPIGVLMPVASMSTRFWIGIVQTFVPARHLDGGVQLAAEPRQLVATDLPEQQPSAESARELVLDGVEGRLRLQDRARGASPTRGGDVRRWTDRWRDMAAMAASVDAARSRTAIA